METGDILSDPQTGLTVSNTLKLHRKVEVFQWKETAVERKEGYALTEEEVAVLSHERKETNVVYEYRGVWSEKWIDSSENSVPWFFNEMGESVKTD